MADPSFTDSGYSSFANTNGGTILLGIHEDQKEQNPEKRFTITGVEDPQQIIDDFWNTINSSKVSANILNDADVFVVYGEDSQVVVIQVPRAPFSLRPVYVGENPFKGSYKRGSEGDYHCSESEVRAMFRDQNPKGNDSLVLEHYTMDDIDGETLRHYRMLFQNLHPDHVWNTEDNRTFLENLGGYRRDRRKDIEGLTLAGFMMFGKCLAIRD